MEELITPLHFDTTDSSTSKLHRKYRDGYWLSTDDISFITNCFVGVRTGDAKYPLPTSYDTLIKVLKNFDCSKYAEACCRLINTDDSFGTGLPWIVAVWDFQNSCLRLQLLDPYPHTKYSKRVEAAIKLAMIEHTKKVNQAKKKINIQFTVQLKGIGLQKESDSFGCGYFSIWVNLILTPYFRQGESADWLEAHSVDGPPKSWFKLIYKVLAIRDIQPDNHSAKHLSMRELWKST